MQTFDPRQEMSSNTFEIFHYRDAKFEGVPIHQHDFYEIYYFISGDAEYCVEGKSFTLNSGDLLIISPLELHNAKIKPNQKPYERIVLWINKSYLSKLCFNKTSLSRCFDNTVKGHTNLIKPSAQKTGFFFSCLKEIIGEVQGSKYANDISCEALLLRFLVELNRSTIEEMEEKIQIDTSSNKIIPKVLDYINEHYCEKLTLSSIADNFFVSKYYLSHSFNDIVGISVHRYIVLKRLINAKQMLLSGIKPTTAAINCGFGDYTGFYRAFTSEYGITPAKFMQKNISSKEGA